MNQSVLHNSALYMMQSENIQRAPRTEPAPIYVSVRAGNAACPAIDMSAVKTVADHLHTTLEDLDGACG